MRSLLALSALAIAIVGCSGGDQALNNGGKVADPNAEAPAPSTKKAFSIGSEGAPVSSEGSGSQGLQKSTG